MIPIDLYGRHILRWTWSSALVVFIFLPFTGCGHKSGLERIYVSGQVTYADKPIELGQIRFVPESNTTAPITVEQIRDGQFETATTGGVPVGSYRVELRMYDPEEYQNAPRTAGSPAVKQLLPDKYNRNSELNITIQSGSSSIEHDFLLEK